MKAGEDTQIQRSEASSCKNKKSSTGMPLFYLNTVHSAGEVAPLYIHQKYL
jgi:hypothetical protein